MMPYANAAEITQTALATVGVSVKIWLLTKAFDNIRWLRRHKFNGPRMFWARSIRRQDWMLLVIHTSFLAMGIASLNLPPPSPANLAFVLPAIPGCVAITLPTEMTLQGELRTYTLMVATILLTGFSLWNVRDREHLIDYPWEDEPWDGSNRRDPTERRVSDEAHD